MNWKLKKELVGFFLLLGDIRFKFENGWTARIMGKNKSKAVFINPAGDICAVIETFGHHQYTYFFNETENYSKKEIQKDILLAIKSIKIQESY